MNNIAGNFLDPQEIIKQVDISRGSIVADFGCGSGFFSLAFAEAVGDEGKVYALDILPSALESVASRAKIQGLTNLVTRRVNLEKEGGSKLADGSINWVVLKDMLFQNKNKEIILKEAYRVLKPGGRVMLIEWNKKEKTVGPENRLRISKEELDHLAKSQEFKFEKELLAGDFHHGSIYIK